MDGLNLGGEAEDFFDKLSDDDAPPGPDEAEEEKPKAKKIKAKVTISNRVTLNERLLTGPKGLVKYLGYFKDVKMSTEKDSEYKNLQTLMSRLERWTHQLYPKFQMDLCLAKIENMGKKSLVRNTIKRVRSNEITDELDGRAMPGIRSDSDDDDGIVRNSVFEEPDPFDDIQDHIIGDKRPNSGNEPEPPAKIPAVISDDQRLRMDENRRKAMEKKKQRELEKSLNQSNPIPAEN